MKSIPWNGKPVGKSGVYSRLPLPDYHRGDICVGPSVSSSGLRVAVSESLAHFYARWPGNPNCIVDQPKAHLTLGRAMHMLMLGEPYLAKLFAVKPNEYADKKTGEMKKWNGNATFCRDWLAARSAEGKEILTETDIGNIRGMAERLSKNTLVRAGAFNGLIERSLFVTDKATGLWLKARPDAMPTASGDYTDFKTTISVQWYDLQKAIFEFGYAQQGALLRTVARELGLPFTSWTLVFVEKEAPWCERVVTVKDSELDRGERANRWALDGIAACLKNGRWPGPGGERDDAAYIELPEWCQKQIDDKLEFGT